MPSAGLKLYSSGVTLEAKREQRGPSHPSEGEGSNRPSATDVNKSRPLTALRGMRKMRIFYFGMYLKIVIIHFKSVTTKTFLLIFSGVVKFRHGKKISLLET